MVIKDFYAEDFGKVQTPESRLLNTLADSCQVYRSCGNCKSTQYKRTVQISGLWAVKGSLIAGVNSNYGDTMTLSGSCLSNVKNVCSWYEGNNNGKEPPKLGTGISSYCKYEAGGIDDCPA